MNGEYEDILVNDNGLEKFVVFILSKVKGVKKSVKKEEVDLGFEDEVLYVEDLEFFGVVVFKVNFIGSGDGYYKILNV